MIFWNETLEIERAIIFKSPPISMEKLFTKWVQLCYRGTEQAREVGKCRIVAPIWQFFLKQMANWYRKELTLNLCLPLTYVIVTYNDFLLMTFLSKTLLGNLWYPTWSLLFGATIELKLNEGHLKTNWPKSVEYVISCKYLFIDPTPFHYRLNKITLWGLFDGDQWTN